MSHRYTRNGQQVLLDGEHFADAASETAAMMILNALLALDERSVTEPVDRWSASERLMPAKDANVSLRITRHIQRREADEYACSCGLRWSVGEDDPH